MNPRSAAERTALLARARSENPGITVPDDAYFAFLDERERDGEPLPDEAASTLYFTLGCVRGDAAALRAFEAKYVPLLRRMAQRVRLGDAETHEIVQRLRVFLLVGNGESRAKLAEYGGHGHFEGWLRVVALRAAVRFARTTSAHANESDDMLLEQRSASDDPELSYLKAVYRDAFREAFAAAIAALEPAARRLLRQHFVDGLTIDELAPQLGVHRATAARRIVDAKTELVASVRREFAARAKLGDREMNSVLRMVESKLGVTLSRLLA